METANINNVLYVCSLKKVFLNSGCEVSNGTTYCFHLEKTTAADARFSCQAIGSKLFEPTNLQSNTFVTQEAKKKAR